MHKRSQTRQVSGILIILLMLLPLVYPNAYAQHVEIRGRAKVADMDTANTENLLVVKKPDGTLATRQVSTLPPDQQDTTRTYATDLELNRLMCDCGNDMKPFLVKSSLAKGYSVEDLVDAGVPLANLIAGDAPIADLLDLGIGPMDLYNNGARLDSIYGKYFRGG